MTIWEERRHWLMPQISIASTHFVGWLTDRPTGETVAASIFVGVALAFLYQPPEPVSRRE